jgi:hypothetical protein
MDQPKPDSVEEKILLQELDQMRTTVKDSADSGLSTVVTVGLLMISSLITILLSGGTIDQYLPYASLVLMVTIAIVLTIVSAHIAAMNWASIRSVKIEGLLTKDGLLSGEFRYDHNLRRRGAHFLGKGAENERLYSGYHLTLAYYAVIAFAVAEGMAADGLFTSVGVGPHTLNFSYPPPINYWYPPLLSLVVIVGSLYFFRWVVRLQIEDLDGDLKQIVYELVDKPNETPKLGLRRIAPLLNFVDHLGFKPIHPVENAMFVKVQREVAWLFILLAILQVSVIVVEHNIYYFWLSLSVGAFLLLMAHIQVKLNNLKIPSWSALQRRLGTGYVIAYCAILLFAMYMIAGARLVSAEGSLFPTLPRFQDIFLGIIVTTVASATFKGLAAWVLKGIRVHVPK